MVKKWRFREDMLEHYINGVSSMTFQDAENRLNYFEELPDMREKVKEYIGELEEEIQRCLNIMIDLTVRNRLKDMKQIELETRIQTLDEVKNDLKNRLEELV